MSKSESKNILTALEFDKFIQSIETSLRDSKQIIKSYKTDHTQALSEICSHIKTRSRHILQEFKDNKYRFQRRDNSTLDYSYEIHQEPEGFVLYVLLKNKGGILNASGISKHVKDCFKFQDGKWSLWVNGTIQAAQRSSHRGERYSKILKKEHENAKLVGENYVVPLKIGAEYQGSYWRIKSKTRTTAKGSVFSEKGWGDLSVLQKKIPQKMNFENLFSICLTSAMSLNAFHSKKLIHRDIKPQNMMLYIDDGFYYVKMFDTEAAITEAESKEEFEYFGTPEFTPPELISAHDLVDSEDIPDESNIHNILQMMQTKKIPEIKASTKIDYKDDVWSLACSLHNVCSAFLETRKDLSEAVQSEIKGLIDFFWDKILIQPRSARPSSKELLEVLQKKIPELEKLGLISTSLRETIQEKYTGQSKLKSTEFSDYPLDIKSKASKTHEGSEKKSVQDKKPLPPKPIVQKNPAPVLRTYTPRGELEVLIAENKNPIHAIAQYLKLKKFNVPDTVISAATDKYQIMALCLHRLMVKKNNLHNELVSLGKNKSLVNLFSVFAGDLTLKRKKIAGIEELINSLLTTMSPGAKGKCDVEKIISTVVTQHSYLTAGWKRTETKDELFDILKFYHEGHLALSKQAFFFNNYRPEIDDKNNFIQITNKV